MNTYYPDDVETKGTDSARYLDGSITIMDGYGSKGAKPHPFNYHAAMGVFNEWAFACATLNADAAAGVPLRMYQRRRRGAQRKAYETRAVDVRTLKYLTGHLGGVDGAGKPSSAVAMKVAAFGGEIEEVVEPHPAMKLLQRPNEDENGYEMAVARFIDLQATGNFWWYVRDYAKGPLAGTPQQLFRLPPQWMHIVPNEKKIGSRRVAGYVYGRRTDMEQAYNADEVDHWQMYQGSDFYYGKGWFEAAWRSLMLDASKRTEDLAFKDNMSRPDWMLAIDGGNRDTMDRMSSKINERHKGPENSGKFLVVQGKATATALQFELKELGTPTRVIEVFAAASKVPVAILLSNDPTKAGSISAKLSWYRTGVRPLCLRDEEKLNQRFLPRFDGSEDYFFAYDHVSFEDEEAVRRSSIASLAGGQLTVDESRAEIGYGPTDGGQTRFFPSGTTGSSAGVVGNMGVSPVEGVANIPKDPMGNPVGIDHPMHPLQREVANLEFERQVYLGFLKDGTVNDVLANMTRLEQLTDDVGIPRAQEYKDGPWLPVVSTSGPVVNGDVLKDKEGDIVGGGGGDPPPEQITITRDASAGAKPPSEPAKPADGVTDGDGGQQDENKPAEDAAKT